MSTTLKIFLYSLFIGILLIAFYLAYAYGEQTGNKNCAEEKVKVVEKVVEVVKEVTKEEQKFFLDPMTTGIPFIKEFVQEKRIANTNIPNNFLPIFGCLL